MKVVSLTDCRLQYSLRNNTENAIQHADNKLQAKQLPAAGNRLGLRKPLGAATNISRTNVTQGVVGKGKPTVGECLKQKEVS